MLVIPSNEKCNKIQQYIISTKVHTQLSRSFNGFICIYSYCSLVSIQSLGFDLIHTLNVTDLVAKRG